MNSTEALRQLLGWSTVLNIGILLFSTVMLISMRGMISRIHGKMFGLDETDVSRAYFQYLAHYKIAIIVFNLVPYLALVIIASR